MLATAVPYHSEASSPPRLFATLPLAVTTTRTEPTCFCPVAARNVAADVAGIPATAVDIMTPEMMRRRVVAEQQRYEDTHASRSMGYGNMSMRSQRARHQISQPRGH